MTAPKHIEPGTRIPFRLSARERDVVLTRAFLEPEIESRLREATAAGEQLVVDVTLDDIDDPAGCVAAERNHCEHDSDRRVLDGLYERLTDLERRFTNAAPASRPTLVATPAKPGFTAKQGQYLSFIYYFSKIHGVAPAEAKSGPKLVLTARPTVAGRRAPSGSQGTPFPNGRRDIARLRPEREKGPQEKVH